jgi:hypothetical protein
MACRENCLIVEKVKRRMAEVFSICSIERRAATPATRRRTLSQTYLSGVTVKTTRIPSFDDLAVEHLSCVSGL